MPKNKFGGSRAKKGKNVVNEKKQLEIKQEGENYAQVTKVLGNGRFTVMCCDSKERIGIIRGSMRKRVWVNHLDILLVEPWEFDNDKGDVLFKYTPIAVEKLKAMGKLTTDEDEF